MYSSAAKGSRGRQDDFGGVVRPFTPLFAFYPSAFARMLRHVAEWTMILLVSAAFLALFSLDDRGIGALRWNVRRGVVMPGGEGFRGPDFEAVSSASPGRSGGGAPTPSRGGGGASAIAADGEFVHVGSLVQTQFRVADGGDDEPRQRRLHRRR